MINVSGYVLRKNLEVNICRYTLCIWLKIWISIRFHGRECVLRYEVKL
jgi:hypothetical protein